MILFFGPAGSGKSVQGQMLAELHGWKWISIGKLLRESKDPEILHTINAGNLVPHEKSSQIVSDAIKQYQDLDHVILDGYPRELEQAQWLIKNTPLHERNIALVIVLDVPKEVLFERLEERGRNDDKPEAIHKRFEVFEHDTMPIINYFTSIHVPLVHVDGSGTIEQVHERIEKVIKDKVT